MNAKQFFAASTLGLGLAMSAAMANDLPTFAEADINADGELSIQEANKAIPALSIRDENADELVNKSEVKAALPEIDFDEEDSDTVGEQEYEQIVEVVSEHDDADVAIVTQ